MNEAHNQTNESKQVLTSTMIKSALFENKPSGILSGIFSVVWFGLAMAGFITGAIDLAVLSLAVGVVVGYVFVKTSRKYKGIKTKILNCDYRIVKTICTDTRTYYDEIAGGQDSYGYDFISGDNLVLTFDNFCSIGDLVYLVYLEGMEKPQAYFNGAIYYPDTDLVILDKT